MLFLKRFFWTTHLATLALGVAIGTYLTVPINESHMESVSQAVGPSLSTVPQRQDDPSPHQSTPIQEGNLYSSTDYPGTSTPRSVSPSPPDPVPTEAPLNLKLIGTVVGGAAHSQAFIEDLSAQRRYVYRIDDIVQGAKILKIGRNRIVLDKHGRREELLNLQTTETTSPSPEAIPEPALQPLSEETEVSEQVDREEAETTDIRKVRDNEWWINREEISKQFETLHQLMREARLIPHFRGDQAAGFMIIRLSRKSFLERIGLHNEDILTGINGQKLNTLEDALQAYQFLQSEPVLQLEIERKQRKGIFTYEIR